MDYTCDPPSCKEHTGCMLRTRRLDTPNRPVRSTSQAPARNGRQDAHNSRSRTVRATFEITPENDGITMRNRVITEA